MGFFSWNTQDTNESIANNYSGSPTFTVYMFDDKGNVWKEDDYEGYGVFGGKDFYELLAEMNGLETRDQGITLFFDKEKDFVSPNLARDKNWEWIKEAPADCEYQGYFYDFLDEEDEW